MASKNSDNDHEKHTIIQNNCQITETIDLVSSEEDEDIMFLGSSVSKANSKLGTICSNRQTRHTDGKVSFNEKRAILNPAIKKRKVISSVLSSESADTNECLNKSGECIKSNSSTPDMETEPTIEIKPPLRNVRKRKFHTLLNGKKQKQSYACRSSTELDTSNSVLVSSKRPVVVINNLNIGLSRMTKENKEHSLNTKISKAKNVEIIDLDPISPSTEAPFSESTKTNNACNLEIPDVDKTELKRILETVNNLNSDNALRVCDKSYQDKLFFPAAGLDSDQSAEKSESSIPINNLTLETKIENFDSSEVSTNVPSLPLKNVTIKMDKQTFYPVDVPTKISPLTLSDRTKTEKENCESSDVLRNLPSLPTNNGTIEVQREIFVSDNVSMNVSSLTSKNLSHSSCLTKLTMQQVRKRIDKTSKESSSVKNADEKNTNNKIEMEAIRKYLESEKCHQKSPGSEKEIRSSTDEEKSTNMKLEEETKPSDVLCNTTEKTFLTDKIPTKTYRKHESSISSNNLALKTEIENFDSSEISTNVSSLTLKNVTIKMDKQDFHPVDVSTKVSSLTVNDTIKTEGNNCESSDVPRNLPALRINNGAIELEREILVLDNVSMNAYSLTSNNFSHSSCLTKLEIQQGLKKNDKSSKESSADKIVDGKNVNNKDETENFQNLLGSKEALKNFNDENKSTNMKLEEETRSHGFLCNPTEKSFLTNKIPTKILKTSESSIPINNLTLKANIENFDSTEVSTNVCSLSLNNVNINTDKENLTPVDVSMKVSLLTLSDTIKAEKEICELSDVRRNVSALTINSGTIEMETGIIESNNVSINASPVTPNNASHSSCLAKLEMQQILKRMEKTSKESSADKNIDEKNVNNKKEMEKFHKLLGSDEEIRNCRKPTDEERATRMRSEEETRSHNFLCNSTERSFLTDKMPAKIIRTSKSSVPIKLTLKTKLENFGSSDVSTNVSPLTLNNVTIHTGKENFNPVDVPTKASLLILCNTIKTDKENYESNDVPRHVPALTLNSGTIEMEREIFESDSVSMNASPLTSNNVSPSSCLAESEIQQVLKGIDKTSKKGSTDKNVDEKNANSKNEIENFQTLLGPEEEIRDCGKLTEEERPTDMKLEEIRSNGLFCNRFPTEKIFLTDKFPTKIYRTSKIPKEKITENNSMLLNIEREDFPTKYSGINGKFSNNFPHRNTNNRSLHSSTTYPSTNNMLTRKTQLNYDDSLRKIMSEKIPVLNYITKSSESCINRENILNHGACYSKSSDSCMNNENVSNQFTCFSESNHLSFYAFPSCVDSEIKTDSLRQNSASEIEDYVFSNFENINYTESRNIPCSSDTELKLQPGILNSFPVLGSIPFVNSFSSQTLLENEATNLPYEKCYLNISTQSPILNPAPSLDSAVYTSEISQEMSSLVPFYLKSLIGNGIISTDNFLLLILEWNADWLTDLLVNQDPPLIDHNLRTVFNSYKYYEDYYNTFFPLMMLETWHRIYATSNDFKQNPPLLGHINEYYLKKHFTEVKCKALYKSGMIFPDVGKIIVVRYTMKSKKQPINVFGYVTEAKSRPIKPVTDSVIIDFLTKKTGMIMDPHQMISLTFNSVYHSEDINRRHPLYIKVLCSIDFNLKQNDALLFTKNCPLQRSILDPASNGFLSFSLSEKHSSEDDVKECVRNILKNVLSPNFAPVIAVRTDIGHSKVVPFLVQAISNDCNKMKILICVRYPHTLGKIAHNLSLLKNVEFVIFNKRADTSSKFHKFTLDKIAQSKEEKIKEIEGDQIINNEMSLKIKKDILQSSDVVLSLIKCSHDKFLAETILEIKNMHKICCIIEEANYCTEPETLIPILLEIGQLILVGDLDEKARVLSKTARDYNFNQSFFQRAYEKDLINKSK